MKSKAIQFQKFTWILSILWVLLVFKTHVVSADIYKWQDTDGIWHFSDTPPISTEAERLDEIRHHATQPVSATPTSPSALETNDPPTVQFNGSMLWRITGSISLPSYLLGTIHSEDPRILALPHKVREHFEQADTFSMEVLLDGEAILKTSSALYNLDGADLETQLGTDRFHRVAQAMAQRGIPRILLRRMKPWAPLMLLGMPAPRSGEFLDISLYRQAQAMGKPVYGLERVEEQLAIFNELSLADQLAMLDQTLAALPHIPKMHEEMITIYLEGDLEAIASTAERYMQTGDQALNRRFMQRMNHERNLRMAERMAPRLAEGNAFIAVGALHLPGKQGLLSLLKQKGYEVTAVR